MARATGTIALMIGVALESGVLAADEPSARSAQSNPRGFTSATGDQAKNTDKPMSGEMKKKGMMQGEVGKAAQKWKQKMKVMMENEEQTGSQKGTAK